MATTPQNGNAPVVGDVRMHESGALVGQVVTPENQPAAGVKLALRTAGKELATTASDKSGYFAFSGLQNGVYELVAPQGREVYRVWTHNTAPPSAQAGALIVNGDKSLVRGQHAMHGIRNMLANPWVVAAIIATAVAIPVAIHNSHHDNPSSP